MISFDFIGLGYVHNTIYPISSGTQGAVPWVSEDALYPIRHFRNEKEGGPS